MEPRTTTADRGRVLLADDDHSVRRAYARVLAAHGHEVVQAGDGREAVAALAAGTFDVVVSDIAMPGISGVELLRITRTRDPDVPVILVTGFAAVVTAVAAVDHGALRYLVKPVETEELTAEVRRAIALGRMARLRRQAADLAGIEAWRLADRATLEENLDRALESLWIAWQPIVRVATRAVVAYEALVRTVSTTLPDPRSLLAAAEHLGRTQDVGRRVRAGVAEVLATAPPHLDAFVNLHPADLLDDDLYAPDAPLTAWASRVVLEVTERASLGVHDEIAARIGALRRAGFRIAIDDLGAGYAGLSWFPVLAPDVVKLDLSLVRDVDRNPVKRRLVGAMTAVCKDLATIVVAEGVETPSERDALVELGCDLLQGYHFARPGRGLPPAGW